MSNAVAAENINSRPGGFSVVPNDHLGRPSLPSAHQIGEAVVLTGTVGAVSFTDDKVYYSVVLTDGRILNEIDSVAVKKMTLNSAAGAPV